MPEFAIPNNASIHTLQSFLSANSPFCDTATPGLLRLHPKWAHMDPVALTMAAAWGGWCRQHGLQVTAENVGQHTNYAARMGLFRHLGVQYDPKLQEHEEAGRFLPITQVKTTSELEAVIGDVSALLHLDNEPHGLAAVRYCLSELIRNVLEHSGSQRNEYSGTYGGAYVCAQRYVNKHPKRVSIAVADCGWGIPAHLGVQYPAVKEDSIQALRMAMQLGVTGAFSTGMYGATENAGAGLFFTRAIAKATGGYFVLLSEDGVFRLRRSDVSKQRRIFWDAFADPRHDRWNLPSPWKGTVAAVEIGTEHISNFNEFFDWVRKQLPAQKTAKAKIRFT